MSDEGRNVTIWMSSEMVDLIDEFVGTHQRTYRNRSHFVEEACEQLLIDEDFLEEEGDE